MGEPQRVAGEIRSIIERIITGGDASIEEIKELLAFDQHFTAAAAEAWHLLYHWAVDADIRASDEEYAAAQRELLASCLPGLNR